MYVHRERERVERLNINWELGVQDVASLSKSRKLDITLDMGLIILFNTMLQILHN